MKPDYLDPQIEHLNLKHHIYNKWTQIHKEKLGKPLDLQINIDLLNTNSSPDLLHTVLLWSQSPKTDAMKENLF